MKIRLFIIAAIKDYILDKKPYPSSGTGHSFYTEFKKAPDGIHTAIELVITYIKDEYSAKALIAWLSENELSHPARPGITFNRIVWNLYLWLKQCPVEYL